MALCIIRVWFTAETRILSGPTLVIMTQAWLWAEVPWWVTLFCVTTDERRRSKEILSSGSGTKSLIYTSELLWLNVGDSYKPSNRFFQNSRRTHRWESLIISANSGKVESQRPALVSASLCHSSCIQTTDHVLQIEGTHDKTRNCSFVLISVY